jgi:hypothetical protein
MEAAGVAVGNDMVAVGAVGVIDGVSGLANGVMVGVCAKTPHASAIEPIHTIINFFIINLFSGGMPPLDPLDSKKCPFFGKMSPFWDKFLDKVSQFDVRPDVAILINRKVDSPKSNDAAGMRPRSVSFCGGSRIGCVT